MIAEFGEKYPSVAEYVRSSPLSAAAKEEYLRLNRERLRMFKVTVE